MWQTWVAGFEEAMRLRPDAWMGTVEAGDPGVAHSMPRMPARDAIQAGESEMPDASIDELTEQAPDLILQIVLTLNGWAKAQRGGRCHLPETPARSTEVGCNDPCPCRSGRKVKKCCWQ